PGDSVAESPRRWATPLSGAANHLRQWATPLSGAANHLRQWATPLSGAANHLRQWATPLSGATNHLRQWTTPLSGATNHLKQWATPLSGATDHLKQATHGPSRSRGPRSNEVPQVRRARSARAATPQRGLLRVRFSRLLPQPGARGDPPSQDVRPRGACAGGRVGRQGLARAVGRAARRRLRRDRPLPP